MWQRFDKDEGRGTDKAEDWCKKRLATKLEVRLEKLEMVFPPSYSILLSILVSVGTDPKLSLVKKKSFSSGAKRV